MPKFRILLVEDDANTRSVLGALLRRQGHEVLASATSEEAQEHIGDCDIDLAILDVLLPGRRGDDFGRELKQRCSAVRVIFLTGEPDVARLKSLVPGSYFIRKPADVNVLNHLIECLPS